ncbi:RNA polymerase sigma factor SigI [Mycolicibacterium fortuitum]|jgi:RNA polymerase sigma-70 factor (ECF subfamily)|uniref:RNA polymerase sigma factor SigI n=1 Tax=Mycolicibacterium fortuitum TaxID=1766 RepID=UPI0007EBA158|nr:RNA polymerase sigma factor SigI [Mycolicibacterium fortuitum]MCA4722834.1 RNA polymerase sigma factor SigI [Mycolicibacterium fortuitum]MCA4755202.1 RNA polymerase sigma factor SigI [Mycolicibacterium fortuitum]OBA98897.1 RNA polymerase subunit sigma [Mycolicibacterium fortuitum]
MNESAGLEAAWRDHHPYLVNLAYRMLGDIGEAEDVAQEAFLRLARADQDHLEDVRAWLTVVAGRLSLDVLRSARARLERPDGAAALDAAAATGTDPADRVTLDDQVGSALLAVLTRLSPGERVAFVLHDIFKVPFEEIAHTVGRPVGTCRQLARRARTKVAGAAPAAVGVDAAEHRQVTDAFITACANGDLAALASVLDPSVWGVGTVLTDPALRQVNHGRHDVATNLLRYLGPGATVVSAAEPVLLAYDRRRLFAVVVLTIRDGLVLKIEATADPSARTQ